MRSPASEVSWRHAPRTGDDAGAPRPQFRSATIRTAAAAGAVYTAIALFAYWHVWTSGGRALVDLSASDPSQNVGLLSWTPFAIAHGHDPFVSFWLNAPFGANLVDNVGMQLLGVLAAPLMAVWGPVTAYNVLLTAAMPLSGLAAFVLACRYVRWRPAAFATGLLYACSPYMVGEGSYHLHLTFLPIPPLTLLVLDDLLVRHRWRPVRTGAALGALLLAQGLISTEVLVLSVLVMAVCGLAAVVTGPPVPSLVSLRRALPALVVAAVIAGGGLAYPLWVGLAGPAHITGPVQLVPQQYRADLLGAVLPDHKEAIAPGWATKVSGRFIGGNSIENGAYLGAPLLAAAAVAAVCCWRRRVVRTASLAAVATFVLSLGNRLVVGGIPDPFAATGTPLPGWLVWHLPILDDALPSRLSAYVALLVGLVVAVGADRAYDRWLAPADPDRRAGAVRRWRPWGAAAVAVVALVVAAPLVPAWPYAAAVPTIPAFFTTPALDPLPAGATVAVYPYPGFGVEDALPMVWQAASGHRFRMMGGYVLVPDAVTGRATTQRTTVTGTVFNQLYAGAPPARTPALQVGLRDELARLGVAAVVAVPSGADPAAAVGYLRWLLPGRPVATGGVLLWRGPWVAR